MNHTGPAWLGLARLGVARLGSARLGSARHGGARQGMARISPWRFMRHGLLFKETARRAVAEKEVRV